MVVVIVLLLMMTVGLASLGYMFVSGMLSRTTETSEEVIEQVTQSMTTRFNIEVIADNKLHVRNLGENDLTEIAVFVNDMLVNYTAPTSIAPGELGEVLVRDFIGKGDKVKLSVAGGLTQMKRAPEPCDTYSVIFCMKFDHSSGDFSKDSSNSGNDGTLMFMEDVDWVSGKYGNSLRFDGINEYVAVGDVVETGNQLTVSAWIRVAATTGTDYFVGEGQAFRLGVTAAGDIECWLRGDPGGISDSTITTTTPIIFGQWHFVSCTWNGATGVRRIYVDGNLEADGTTNVISFDGWSDSNNFAVGVGYVGAGSYFNGDIDEIRIYSREIY